MDCLLEEVVTDKLSKLKDMDAKSEEYKTTVDTVGKLIDKMTDREKLFLESEERDLKRDQFEDEKKDRKVRNVLSAAGIILPLGVTIWGTFKSFKFEQEGTITTIMGRGFIQKLLPKK